jgi:hypothetical protein
MSDKKLFSTKLDDFLKLYSQYQLSPTPHLRETILSAGRELKQLNPAFSFDRTHLKAA